MSHRLSNSDCLGKKGSHRFVPRRDQPRLEHRQPSLYTPLDRNHSRSPGGISLRGVPQTIVTNNIKPKQNVSAANVIGKSGNPKNKNLRDAPRIATKSSAQSCP
ncbi:hypothetical protein BIW11_04204, partial [Tropilaelaps mercedesae]